MRTYALILLMLILAVEFGIGSQAILTESTGSQKEVTLSKELYFVGEEVEIHANFLPEKAWLIDPTGNKTILAFESNERGFVAKLKLEKGIILGEYRLIADEIEKRFLIDFCELNASYEKGFLNITAKTFFSKPEFEFKIDYEYGKSSENVSFPLKAGKHEFVAICGNAELKGELEVNFTIEFAEGKIYSLLDREAVNATLKVLAEREYEFQGSFSLEDVDSTNFTVKAEYLHLETVRSFNFEFGLKDLYFPGEEIVIHSELFKWAKILDPAGREFKLNFENALSRFRLEKGILLGEYRLIVAGIEKRFFVDSYSINASFKEGKIIGNVSYYFVEPEFVYYKIGSIEGKTKVVNGSFEIPVSLPAGNYTALLNCGNAILELKISVEEFFIEPLYSLGEKIAIKLKFKPERALLLTPTKSVELNFIERNGFYYTEFIAEEVGKHSIQIDQLKKEFLVDDCLINASFIGREVQGNVSWHFSKPEFIEVCEENCYKIKLEGNQFSFKSNADQLLLICRNAKLEISRLSEKRALKTEFGTFKFYLDHGEFEKLEFNEEKLFFAIKTAQGARVKLQIELPFEIPEGQHVYFWKNICGELKALDHVIEGKKLVFELQDGLIDEDCKANGVIVDPLKLQIPKYKVERKLEGKKGFLRIEKEKAFEIKFESSNEIKYLAFVDPDNLPSKPAEFPYGLLKFRIAVEDGGEAEIRITYPSLEDLIDDSGMVTFYKFNPQTLEWESFSAEVENNTVILRFQDGGFGDEDGVANGVISDDGGVGWVGYGPSGTSEGATVSGANERIHVYWLYVPSGSFFNVSIWDGEGLVFRAYYPNGSLAYSYTTTANNGWDNFSVPTYNNFGWWRIEIEDDWANYWPWSCGNYYALYIRGADEINIRVNSSTQIGTQTFYRSPDKIVVGTERRLSPTQNYYVFGENFNLSIFDPDSVGGQAALRVTVYYPNGTIFTQWEPIGDDVWSFINVFGELGIWRINVTEIQNYDDYWGTQREGNQFRLAVNLSEGLYFKPPALLNINGRVLHDLFPLGSISGDSAIRGVEVLLVEDLNGNRIPDGGDRILRRNLTDINGNFSFLAVKDITRTYFVVVNSKSINATNATLSYNSGFNITHIWAEESYQSNESNYSQVIPFFGGRIATRSDNVTISGANFLGWAEHYITINSSTYNNETLYFGFNFSLVVNSIDEDHDTANPRFCQGCLRQFILNANAIAGKQRSYFVMATAPNVSDGFGRWHLIGLNTTLGSLSITEALELNATVLNSDMTVNDSNAGFVTYDYTTRSLITVATQTEIPVGVGEDGIPFSGDEAKLKAIPRPEIEIFGSNLLTIFIVSASGVEFRNFAIFGTQLFSGYGNIYVNGNDFLAENIFAGLRANASDPKLSGLNRTGTSNLFIERNNSTVRNSIVAFGELGGLTFNSINATNGRVENVIGFRNGLYVNYGANFAVQVNASNATFTNCVSSKASGNGIETDRALRGIAIFDCTIENNGFGPETGSSTHIAGVRIHANHTMIARSLIRDNGVGVLVINMSESGPAKQVFNVTITKNSIYNNSRLGIDLTNVTTANLPVSSRGDNVTLNDGILNCLQPNCGMDYPVITFADFDESEQKLYVEGFIGSESLGGNSVFANSRVEIYLVRNLTAGDDLIGNNWTLNAQLPKHYGEGFIYLGELIANSTGYFSGEINVAGKGVVIGSLITGTATLNGNTSEFGPNALIRKKLNLSAEIYLKGLNATIKVKAFEKVRNVNVYWFKPNGIQIASMSGDYNAHGSQGNFYWWKFNRIEANEEKFVYLNLTASGAFFLSEALNIGVDPS